MTDRRKLYLGNQFTGITIAPDEKYPTMWRVCHKERVSDMVNLSRAKDAATTIAADYGFRDRGVGRVQFNWRGQAAGGAVPALKSGQPSPQ